MDAARSARGRRFWGLAIVIVVVSDVILIGALSFTRTIFGIQGVGSCVDYTLESGMRSTCTQSLQIGAGAWLLGIAGVVAVVFLGYRLVRSSRKQ